MALFRRDFAGSTAQYYAPLHIMHSIHDLFQGTVAVGVRPALPVEGIMLILGNVMAGGRVWADVPPPPVSAVYAPSAFCL